MSSAQHNQSLQPTVDPAGSLAVARAPAGSTASEPRRYASLGWALAILGPFFAGLTLASDQLVDEATVQSWGYETISTGKTQTIRRVEPHRAGSDVYYPKFDMWRECYESSDAASSKLNEIRRAQKTEGAARDFDYRRGFVVGLCVYLMNTRALLYKLEFLDELFSKYESLIRARARDA